MHFAKSVFLEPGECLNQLGSKGQPGNHQPLTAVCGGVRLCQCALCAPDSRICIPSWNKQKQEQNAQSSMRFDFIFCFCLNESFRGNIHTAVLYSMLENKVSWNIFKTMLETNTSSNIFKTFIHIIYIRLLQKMLAKFLWKSKIFTYCQCMDKKGKIRSSKL